MPGSAPTSSIYGNRKLDPNNPALNPDVIAQLYNFWGDRNPLKGGGGGGARAAGSSGTASTTSDGTGEDMRTPFEKLPWMLQQKLRMPGYDIMNDPNLTGEENFMFRYYFPNIFTR